MKREERFAVLMSSTFVLTVGLVLWGAAPGASQGEDPETPQAQATQRAAERAERHRIRLDPRARQTARAVREEEQHERALKYPQPVEVRQPMPLPVELRNANALCGGGRPIGAICQGTESCTLQHAPAPREVVVLTAVWSARRITCDDLTSASPANGAAISPWWRCERQLVVEGPGAGYTGFVVLK